MPEKLIIKCPLSPGDIVTLTGAIRDLHRAHPGRYVTDVRTPRPDLWEYNPFITQIADDDPEARMFDAHYPLIQESNQKPFHFIHGYRKHLADGLGIKIPQGEFKGDIHLSQNECTLPGPVETKLGHFAPYWVVVNGGKPDFTVKHWHPMRMQEVVDSLPGITFAQTGMREHMHKPLSGANVIDMMDCMHRDYIRLIYHAHGVICPITFAMHLAAAVPRKPGYNRHRPCVVIAGGREAAHWEQYPGHRYLDTIGSLPCCGTGGCWKARVVKLDDGDHNDTSLCERPVDDRGISIPRCMDMIKTADVVRAINSYLEFK